MKAKLLLSTLILFSAVNAAESVAQEQTVKTEKISKLNVVKNWIKKNPKKSISAGALTWCIIGYTGTTYFAHKNNIKISPWRRMASSPFATLFAIQKYLIKPGLKMLDDTNYETSRNLLYLIKSICNLPKF